MVVERDKVHKPARMTGTHLDISKQKLAEEYQSNLKNASLKHKK